MPRASRLRPARSPEAPLSASSCLRLPGASARLGPSAAWVALTGHMGLVFHIWPASAPQGPYGVGCCVGRLQPYVCRLRPYVCSLQPYLTGSSGSRTRPTCRRCSAPSRCSCLAPRCAFNPCPSRSRSLNPSPNFDPPDPEDNPNHNPHPNQAPPSSPPPVEEGCRSGPCGPRWRLITVARDHVGPVRGCGAAPRLGQGRRLYGAHLTFTHTPGAALGRSGDGDSREIG